jgi:hypothetical protein
LLTPSVEDHPASDAMVEAMDLSVTGFIIDLSRVGNPRCDLKVMLKVI